MQDHTRSERLSSFLITFLFGWFGLHRFLRREIGMGILYLCTGGLFGIGWMVDCVRSLLCLIREEEEGEDLDSAIRCRRCGRRISFSHAQQHTLCHSCESQLNQEYTRTAQHFSRLTEEAQAGYPHLEDYLRTFAVLLNDVDRLEEMADELQKTPPFQKAELQRALNQRFTEAVSSRISMALEKSQINSDLDRLKSELTALTEELIDCKYRYPQYTAIITPMIDQVKKTLRQFDRSNPNQESQG